MVGLATAWFLQERGVEVTVIDREGVAAGSSWGNAGWLTPGITTPLPEPAVLKYGLRAVLSPNSPVYVPPSANPSFLKFVAGFTRHSTAGHWRQSMGKLVPVNGLALESFDLLKAGGVRAETVETSSFLAAYRTADERRTLLEEIEHIHAAGQDIEFDVLTGDEARAIEPVLSDEVGAAIRLRGQRFINPGAYVHALADAVIARGGKLATGPSSEVLDIVDAGRGVRVVTTGGVEEFDSAVLATGAWMGKLARRFGVRSRGPGRSRLQLLGPGRPRPGRSRVPAGPARRLHAARRPPARRRDDGVPLPRGASRRASGPGHRGRRAPVPPGGRPRRPRGRVGRLAAVHLDGLPLIGATRSPRVYAAGGHGMWGITLGPATGRLLAEQMVSGRTPAELAPFSPTR